MPKVKVRVAGTPKPEEKKAQREIIFRGKMSDTVRLRTIEERIRDLVNPKLKLDHEKEIIEILEMIDHIKPYNLADGYIRLWPEDGGVMYDFGSWTDFYFWGKRGEQDNE